jgi:5'-deoxynucleotidase YfbR-like HD superfamily hydrolase
MSAGPAGPYETMRPRNLHAVAYETPQDFETTTEAPFREPLFTPEINGKVYNVRDDSHYDPDDIATHYGAEAYLIEANRLDLKKIRGNFDAVTLFHLAIAIRDENRQGSYEDGTPQNVAEHSLNLAVTVAAAAKDRPDLDPGKSVIMAVFHDLMYEGYGTDTPVKNEEAVENKLYIEEAGFVLFLRDLGDNYLRDIALEYHEGKSKEAIYVKAMDKLEVYQLSLDTKAYMHVHRNETDWYAIVEEAIPKVAKDHTAFNLMKGVLKQLGYKWNKWVNKEFSINPRQVDEFVERIANEVLAEQQPELSNVCSLARKALDNAEVKLVGNDSYAIAEKTGATIIRNLFNSDTHTPSPDPVAA